MIDADINAPDPQELDMSRLELMFTREQIQEQVEELAAAIDEDFAGSNLVVVGILKGAFQFLSDLVRELRTPCEVDFMWLSSYQDKRFSAGEIRLRKDLELPVRDRDLLVVEDIVDTGLSVRFLRRHLEIREPSRLAFATLVNKKSARITEATLDYSGFQVDRGFLVGYGMDDAEKYRALPEIYRIEEEG